MQIDLLGRFAVRSDGREIDAAAFGGRLVRRLLRILALERGRVASRSMLIEALWPDRKPADPEANLAVLVNRARRALGDPSLIETAAAGYAMSAGRGIVVDMEVFRAHVEAARTALDQGKPADAGQEVRRALALWPDEPLPEDVYEDWARPHRDRVERVFQDALELGAEVALATHDARRAADLAAEAVSRQPLREATHLLLIRALAEGGDHAAALAAYDKLRSTLADELGVDPSKAATELHSRLLHGQPLTGPPQHPVAAPSVPFVGRQRELRTLRQVVDEGGIALVSGRSGAGKSRLLRELGSAARPALRARAVLPERVVPWSLARGLLQAALDRGADPHRLLPHRTVAALAEILPALDADPMPADPQTKRALVLQGATRVVQSLGHAVLVVDDLQWADSSSLEFLLLLAARSVRDPMVLAYRPEELTEGSPVTGFLADLRAVTEATDITLGKLNAKSIGLLVHDDQVAVAIAEHTDGTPFAVLEVIRDLRREGALRGEGPTAGVPHGRTPPSWPGASAVPASSARSGRGWNGGRPTGEICSACSPCWAGRLRLTCSARQCGWTPSTYTTPLRHLARAELVRHEQRGFAAAHDLVAEAVREQLEPVQRAHLHQRLVQALTEQNAPADELAGHLAGAGDTSAAAGAFLVAARNHLERCADREAEHLAEQGLTLRPDNAPRCGLLEVRAETRARRGDVAGARDDLRAALTLAESGVARSRLLARLAAGHTAEALDAADGGVAIARRLGHRGWTSMALRARGIALQAADDAGAAESAFRESLAASEHFPLLACWAHARLAMVLIRLLRVAEAVDHVDAALVTGPPLGHYEARLARCELAVARREVGAVSLIAETVEHAGAGGHRSILPCLADLRDRAAE